MDTPLLRVEKDTNTATRGGWIPVLL